MAKSFHGLGTTTGLAADRSALASPVAGQQFYETDTNTLYVYTGSAWVKVLTADDQAYGQFVYDGSGLVANTGNTVIPFTSLVNSKSLTLSNSPVSGAMLFEKTGVYEFSVGHRFGSGNDTWTGVNLYNTALGTVLARAYGTGQVGGADPGPVSYSFLAQITANSSSGAPYHQMRIYRNSGALTMLDPDDSAGYQITCTVKRLSS